MSDKHLIELSWKTLLGKHKLKDTKLSKALGDLAKCEATDFDGKIKALAAVDKEAELLKKEHKANKEVDTYLGEVVKEVDKTRKQAEQDKKIAQSKAAAKEKADAEKKVAEEKKKAPKQNEPDAKKKPEEEEKEGEEQEDEEEVDIKSALTGAMGKVKARKPADPPMGAMLCQCGKEYGVLLGRNVGAAQQKKLKEVLKGTSYKFAKGTCEWGKGDIYTFILESPLSGAAAGLKKFFQEHAGASYKLRVGAAGAAMEEDFGETEESEAESTDDPKLPTTPSKVPPTPPKVGANTPPIPPKPTTVPNPTLSSFVKAKKEWKAAKAAAEKGVAALKTAILQQCDPELEAPVKAKIDVWDSILGVVDDSRIIPLIDEAIKETEPDRQAQLNLKLAGVATSLQAALQQHALASVADSNPFGKFYIRTPLSLMLTRLNASFGG